MNGNTTVDYDPKGRLNKIAAPSGTTRFLYDGDQLALEYASNGTTILRRYVHGAGVDDPIPLLARREFGGRTSPGRPLLTAKLV